MIARKDKASSETQRPVERKSLSARSRMFLWVFSWVMILTAGTAFVFKLIEFFHTATTMGRGALASFLIPLLTYLIVAAGFASMFMWSYLSGHYKDVEAAKYRMLEMQQEIDAAEAQ